MKICYFVLMILMTDAGYCQAQDGMDLIDDTKSPRGLSVPKYEVTWWSGETNFERDMIYSEMRLKEGDLIKKLNGKVLTKDDMVLISLSLRKSKEFTIVIERDGKEKTIRYQRPK
ncbi:MAG: hypothetical protein ACXVA9_09505 [Bdellovibrionales bacterium]